jgi:putative transposon-encoded protein
MYESGDNERLGENATNGFEKTVEGIGYNASLGVNP